MSCEDCEKFREGGNTSFYRWKHANVEMRACPEHLRQIYEALGKVQLIESGRFRENDTADIQSKPCTLTVGRMVSAVDGEKAVGIMFQYIGDDREHVMPLENWEAVNSIILMLQKEAEAAFGPKLN